jgi:hypothetical protein
MAPSYRLFRDGSTSGPMLNGPIVLHSLAMIFAGQKANPSKGNRTIQAVTIIALQATQPPQSPDDDH